MRRALLVLPILAAVLAVVLAHTLATDTKLVNQPVPVAMAGSEDDPGTVIVVGNHAPPYRIIDSSGFSGIYFDTMKEIAARIGVKPVFQEVPFPRALALMEKGQADIMLGTNRTPEREAYMVYTAASFPAEPKAFFLTPGGRDIASYADLHGRTVCVNLGKSIDPAFDHDPEIAKRDSISQLAVLQDTLTGKCDAAVLPEQEAVWLMLQLGAKLERATLTLPGRESYLTLARDSNRLGLQSDIEAAMRAIIEDGTFERILGKYR